MPRERRIGENEALFRDVNERVRELNEAYPFTVPTTFVCECANTGCFERVDLTPAEYEAVRRHPARFLVFPDDSHVAPPDVERVAERHDSYWVVEKIGLAGRIAEDRDTRTG